MNRFYRTPLPAPFSPSSKGRITELDLESPDNYWLAGTEVRYACRVSLPSGDSVVVGLQDYLTTRAIVVGLRNSQASFYDRRYCYPVREDANVALHGWVEEFLPLVGSDPSAAGSFFADRHPPGPWVKVKGRYRGEVADDLNPALG